MASNPKSGSDKGSPSREPLPFEPAQSRKSSDKKAVKKSPVTSALQPKTPDRTAAKADVGIPEVVSKRMVRRMAVFCGIPTALGISTFIVSYFVVSRDLFELPTVAVLFVSLGFFGLGVLGLTYGALSASWDEDTPGTALGLSNFGTNFGRMREAWRSQRSKT